MKELIAKLQSIEDRLIAMSNRMAYETKIEMLEMEERERLGLHGDDAYRHYVQFMQRHGLM